MTRLNVRTAFSRAEATVGINAHITLGESNIEIVLAVLPFFSSQYLEAYYQSLCCLYSVDASDFICYKIA